MKENIHPKYEVVEVVCACGAKFKTRSTMKAVKLDICSACHPFFTGKQKMLDTEGRVEKFNKKFASTQGKMVVRKPKTEVKAKKGTVKMWGCLFIVGKGKLWIYLNLKKNLNK